MPPVPCKAASSVNCADTPVGAHIDFACPRQFVGKLEVPVQATAYVNLAVSARSIEGAQAPIGQRISFVPAMVAAALIATAAEFTINGAVSSGLIEGTAAPRFVKRVVIRITRCVLRNRRPFAIPSVINDLGYNTGNSEACDDLGNIIAVSSGRRWSECYAKCSDEGECEW